MSDSLNTQVGVEVWKAIPGYDDYEVSNKGRIGSWKPFRNFAAKPETIRIVKPSRDKNGYKKVILTKNGVRSTLRICRIVATAWHGSPQPNQVVRHLDGSKDNDTPENLAWGTPKENSFDQVIHGTVIRGIKVNTCKLSPSMVLEIRSKAGRYLDIAKQYGVTAGQVGHIKNRRVWKWL